MSFTRHALELRGEPHAAPRHPTRPWPIPESRGSTLRPLPASVTGLAAATSQRLCQAALALLNNGPEASHVT